MSAYPGSLPHVFFALTFAVSSTVFADEPLQKPDPADGKPYDKRMREFVSEHSLHESTLFKALAAGDHIADAVPSAGPPQALAFSMPLDGRRAKMLYVPAQAGDPPVEEGLYVRVRKEDGTVRLVPLEQRAQASGNRDWTAEVARILDEEAPPPVIRRVDARHLQKYADRLDTTDKRDDALAALSGGTLLRDGLSDVKRESELRRKIDKADAQFEKLQAAAITQGEKTPKVNAYIASLIEGVEPPPLQKSEVLAKADLTVDVEIPGGDGARGVLLGESGDGKGGFKRPVLALHLADEKQGEAAKKALDDHKSSVKRQVFEKLKQNFRPSSIMPFGWAVSGVARSVKDVVSALRRVPKRAEVVLNLAEKLDDGISQANDGIDRMPEIGAAIAVAGKPEAAKAEGLLGVWGIGGFARAGVKRKVDIYEARGKMLQARGDVLDYTADSVELGVLEAKNRVSPALTGAGITEQAYYATVDGAQEGTLRGRTGGPGAFYRYRLAEGGDYLMPLGAGAEVLPVKADFSAADLTARVEGRLTELYQTPERFTADAVRGIWVREISRIYRVDEVRAGELFEALH